MMFTEFFASHALALLIVSGILGLLIGSFLNVVIYRLPLMLEQDWRSQCHEYLELPQTGQAENHFSTFNLVKPDSHCPQCKHAISALENIPVLSYLLQGGKCRHCKARIPLRYPLIELATALLSVVVVANTGFSWLSLALLVFTWTLLALTMIDIDHQLLPDSLTLPLLWLGLLLNNFTLLVDLHNAVLGAIAGYLILWLIYWIFKILTGKEGMGYGDFKLLAALGAWLGWQALPQIILLSSLVGALTGIALIVLRGHKRNIPIPFGPYLACAGFISLFWGQQLTTLFYTYIA